MIHWARDRWRRIRNWWSRTSFLSSTSATPRAIITPSSKVLAAQETHADPSARTPTSNNDATKASSLVIDTTSLERSVGGDKTAIGSQPSREADKVGLVPITRSPLGARLPVIQFDKASPGRPTTPKRDDGRAGNGDGKRPSDDRIVVVSPLSDRPLRSRALLIGIHYTQHQDKKTWEPLTTPGKDVKNMHAFLTSQGYTEIRILTDSEKDIKSDGLPTLQTIREGLNWLVEDAREGDRLFLHYSGHGNQVPTDSTSETDGHDEALVPLRLDGDSVYFLDNELHETLVKPLPSGCTLMAVFDCCHAGTMLDLPHAHTMNFTRRMVSEGLTPFRKTNRMLRRVTRRAQTWLVSQYGTTDSTTSGTSTTNGTLGPKEIQKEELEAPHQTPLRRSSTHKSVVVRKTNANVMKLRYSYPEQDEGQTRRRSTRISIPPSPAVGPASGRRSNASPGDGRPKSNLFGIDEDAISTSPLNDLGPLRTITASPRSTIDETMIDDGPIPVRKNTLDNSRSQPTRSHSFHDFSTPGSEDFAFHETAQIIAIAACLDSESVFDLDDSGGLLTSGFIGCVKKFGRKEEHRTGIPLGEMVTFLEDYFKEKTEWMHTDCPPRGADGECGDPDCPFSTEPPVPLVTSASHLKREDVILI